MRAASAWSATGSGSIAWTTATARPALRFETFWLDGPLEISALEQVRFVTALAQQRLPVLDRTQSIVRGILRLEASDGQALYGKTGWCFSSTPQLGWWTGWAERGDQRFVFALNIDMASSADAPKRVAVGKRMLSEFGVL